jgi:outer membrane protein assembly factor BamA
MFQAYDRPSFIVGPFVDQNARGGVKVGLFAPNRATINGFFGAMPSLDRIIAGGEAKLTYLYGTNWNAGIFYEDGINRNFSTSASQTQSGGRMYLRKVLLQSSSVLDDDAAFYEIYTGHGNIFWAGDIGRPTPGALNAAGMRLKINTQAPFWDPVEGRLFEINGEFGAPAYEANYQYYTRWQVNAGQVWTLGDAFGPLENTRFAVRGMGGMAWPQDVNFFRLGSGQVNRALGFNAQNGSAFWLASAEWRFPIIQQLDKSVFDKAMTFDKVSGVLFYDVGETALKQQFRPVVQGVGFGFRVDTVLFGFLERVNLRFDIAQPVSGAKGGPLFWFGFNQVF